MVFELFDKIENVDDEIIDKLNLIVSLFESSCNRYIYYLDVDEVKWVNSKFKYEYKNKLIKSLKQKTKKINKINKKLNDLLNLFEENENFYKNRLFLKYKDAETFDCILNNNFVSEINVFKEEINEIKNLLN